MDPKLQPSLKIADRWGAEESKAGKKISKSSTQTRQKVKKVKNNGIDSNEKQ